MAQAERCKQSEVEIHVARQKKLGERMIGDTDRPRLADFAITGACIVALLAYAYHKGLYLPWQLL